MNSNSTLVAGAIVVAAAACAMPSPSEPAGAPRNRTELARQLTAISRAAPIVVAHRGASHDYPENTMPAFAAAVASGAPMVELDFRQTAEGELVVVHDATYDRTTDSSTVLGERDVRVDRTTLAQARRLDAGRWKHPSHAGAAVPTLGEALQLIQAGSITMAEHKAGDAERLVQLLRDAELIDTVLVQSFDWDWLRRVHVLEPAITIAALGHDELTDARLHELPSTGASMVHWSGRDIRAGDVQRLQQLGYLVCVYTLNDDVALAGAAALGIDAITTDRPAHLLDLLRQGIVRRGR